MTPDIDVYVTSLGNFALLCRHCRKTKAKHVEERCLFDSTVWAPMSHEEFFAAWRSLAATRPIRTEDLEEA